MRAVKAGRVDTIVCWKADRLSRNAADAGTVLFALESRQLRTIVTADGTYAADADSELMLGILLGFSAKYSKDLSKNIRRGMEEKLRRGEWSWNAPVGYKNVRLTGDRAIVVVDEATAPYVRQLFELAATGDYSLNDLVAVTRDTWKLRRAPRRATSTRLGLSHTTIDHILHNPSTADCSSRKDRRTSARTRRSSQPNF
jgi:DNA invertase Pin-like site-specific DNA recombinase